MLLTGCSVGMAARTSGVKVEQTTQCQTRDCFLSQDTVEVIDRNPLDNGGYVETYRFQLKRGSAGRAAMHGLLDVATLGIWEVAGTPIEATKRKKFITITGVYDASGRLLSKSIGAPPPTELVSKDHPEEIALEQLTPVTANGELVGYLTPEGEIIPLQQQDQISPLIATSPTSDSPPPTTEDEFEGRGWKTELYNDN